jgi:hypothetical protein
MIRMYDEHGAAHDVHTTMAAWHRRRGWGTSAPAAPPTLQTAPPDGQETAETATGESEIEHQPTDADQGAQA